MSQNDDDKEVEPQRKGRPKLFTRTLRISTPYKNSFNANLDQNSLYEFNERLIRVEFPGQVKNVDRAIQCMGGMKSLEKSVETRRLELIFHPENLFMHGCFGDLVENVGFLIKVSEIGNQFTYEVAGAIDKSFEFNRMCDFQYLPLVSTKQETKDSEVEFIQDKIVLDQLPNLKWFTEHAYENELFLSAGHFARFDLPNCKFHPNTVEIFNSLIRGGASNLSEFSKQRGRERSIVPAIKVALPHETKIPLVPLPEALHNVSSKFLQSQMKLVKNVFEIRPVWTKSGILYQSKVNHDAVKLILPCLAYHCNGGPWRNCWIKLGYNPVQDYTSRIYQVLDFRIRRNGLQVAIKRKRNTFKAGLDPPTKDSDVGDRNFIIRPNQIPPARQVFYQYCDVHLPEVQDMLLKLPKLPSTAKCDTKNGWLPLSFQEHCREIVNKYVFEAVQSRLAEQDIESSGEQNVAAYCSNMLDNIRKGVTRSLDVYSGGHSRQEKVLDEIYLSDEEQEMDVVDTLPERITEDFDDDDDDDSDYELDLEAVEEVNKIVAGVEEDGIGEF